MNESILNVNAVNGAVMVDAGDLKLILSPAQARALATTICRKAAIAEQNAPLALHEIELYAYLGLDERGGPPVYGLKQGITHLGLIPLVSTRQHRIEDEFDQMEAQASKWGQRIRLCRYIFAGVLRTTKAGTDPIQVAS